MIARKHFSQFTAEEPGFITGYIRRQIAPRAQSARTHFHDRATERNISLAEARLALQRGLVIEVHNMATEWRALVRDRAGICTVVSLESAEIITAFYNDPTDKHETLNRALYQTGHNLDVVALVKSLLHRRHQ